MTPDLQWLASRPTSCLHAAEAVARGRSLVDKQLEQVVAGPAAELQREIVAAGLPAGPVWQHLLGLAASMQGHRQLVELALRKVLGADSRVGGITTRLAGAIRDLEGAVSAAFPKMEQELALRGKPLREQWEARGPGLLKSLAHLTDENLIVARADVVLVHPALGGAGGSHLPYNRVRIEAVLAHPHPRLPETVRLGWLLAQLNLDLPMHGESIHANRLPHIAALAMIPATLQAAAQVELATFDASTVELALQAWHIATPADVEAVDILTDWWATCADTQPRWNVAMAALDQMLG